MADVVPIHNPNTVTGDSDQRFLNTQLLDSMVLRSFQDQNVFHNSRFIQTMNLAPGQSSNRWKVRGDSPEDAEHHVRGQRILGGTRVNTNYDVDVDDELIKALQMSLQDQVLSASDELQPDVDECIRIVSEKQDKRIAIVGLLAARTAAVTNVHNGGNRVLRKSGGGAWADLTDAYAVSATGADAFSADASNLARLMDEDNIPRTNRFLFISPFIKQVLTWGTNRVINKDHADGGNFSIERRIIGMLEGFNLVETLHLPSTNVTTDLTKYNGNFAIANGLPAALAMYNGPGNGKNPNGPVGGVTAGSTRNKIYYDENYNSWLIKSQTIAGFGIVAPWLAGEIYVNNDA